MTIVSAIKHYSILSIGDGLVSQIPSIIIAISSGFLVSKIRSKNTISYDLTKQLLKHTQPIAIAAVVIGAFALVPGFPKTPFLGIAAACAFFAWSRKKPEGKVQRKTEDQTESKSEDKAPVEEMLDVDVLSILVGVRLISMVDPRKKSSVFERIGALRKKFAQQLGFIIPLVRLRDNINLEPNAYEIRLHDHIIATGQIEPDKFLAMDSGTVTKQAKGQKTTEPVYGLPALWITASEKENAELAGYTVIDPESVLITHLSETLSKHANELLTREDVQQLVERLRQSQPSLVGDVVGELVSVGLLQQVLQNLLKEGVSIRDLSLVLEVLSHSATKTKSPMLLTELARKSLARTITERNIDTKGTINAIAFEPTLEHHLISTLQQGGETVSLMIPPEEAMELNKNIAEAWKTAMDKSFDSTIMLCDARLRPGLYGMIERTIPRLPVLAYDEIIPGTNTEVVETVSITTPTATAFEQNQTAAV